MFGNKTKLEIEEEITQRTLKLSLMKQCCDATLRTVKTDSGESAVVQIAGIKCCTQEKKGWFYGDQERDTMLVKYLDDSWVRLDMKVEEFIRQVDLPFPAK